MNLTYRKEVGQMTLKVDGIEFGRILGIGGYWIYSGDFQEQITFNDRMTLAERLARVREVMEINAPIDDYNCDAEAERALELSNHEWAERQTAIDAMHGM